MFEIHHAPSTKIMFGVHNLFSTPLKTRRSADYNNICIWQGGEYKKAPDRGEYVHDCIVHLELAVMLKCVELWNGEKVKYL